MKKRPSYVSDRKRDHIPAGSPVRAPETDTKDDTGIRAFVSRPTRSLPCRQPFSGDSGRTSFGKKAAPAAVSRCSAHGQNRVAKEPGQAHGPSVVSRPMPYPEPTASRIFRQTRPDSIFRPHALLDPDSGSDYPPPHERKEPDSDQSRPGRKNVRTSRLCASVRRRKRQTVPRKKCFATDSRPKK